MGTGEMNRKKFLLTSEELELLMAFETNRSLEQLSLTLGRDPTVISRALKRIASKAPVIEKLAGRWSITPMGRKMNSATIDLLLASDVILRESTSLRIGSNQQFVPRVLVPSIEILLEELKVENLTVKTFAEGTERALLDGQIDVSFDCGKPHSNEISFKQCIEEPISIICSPSFYAKNRLSFDEENLKDIPMILCDRLLPDRLAPEEQIGQRGSLYFNDIASARAACLHGLGWMFIPLYAARTEIEARRLMCPYKKSWGREKYGIWWLRSRKFVIPSVKILANWLSSQKL